MSPSSLQTLSECQFPLNFLVVVFLLSQSVEDSSDYCVSKKAIVFLC